MGEFMISSSVLILSVIVLRAVSGRRIGFRMRYAMWLIVVLRLALPFTMPGSPFSIMNAVTRIQSVWENEAAAQDRSGEAGTVTMADSLPGEEAGDGIMLMVRQGAAEVSRIDITQGMPVSDGILPQSAPVFDGTLPQRAPLEKRMPFTSLLPIIWMAGAVCIGAYLMAINLIVWGRLRRTRVLVNPAGDRKKGAELPVYRCEKLASPCLFGLRRPAVYLNEKALADERSRRYAMAHEREHYRHKDHIWSFVRLVMVTVYWFHPLVWAAAVLSARDCELACDEGVTARITEEECTQYGRALLSQVPLKRVGMPFTVSTSMSGGARQLKRRLLAITHRRKVSAGAVLLTAAMLLLAAGCTFTGADDRSSDTEENSAGNPAGEGGGQESGTGRPAADGLFAEDGADAGMAGGAGREENDAGGPAAQASPDLELLSLFEDSVQFDEDGNLYFTIPQSSHAPEDWAISFSGKKSDGSDFNTTAGSVIVEVSGGEAAGQSQKKDYVEMDCVMPGMNWLENSELSMVVSLSSFSEDGEETRTAITIDLLEKYQEMSKQEEAEGGLMQTALCAYSMFPDGSHGWALTDDHRILYTYEGDDRFSILGSLPFVSGIRSTDAAGGNPDTAEGSPDEADGSPDAAASFLEDSDMQVSSCFLNETTAYFAGVSANEGEALVIRLSIQSEPAVGDDNGQILVSEHRTRVPLQAYYPNGDMYVSFADSQNGYLLVCSDPAAGLMEKHLYETTDGGDSFSFVADLSGVINGYPSGMAFCSRDTGYIGVSPRHETDYLYGTQDGGRTWESVSVPVHEDAYYADAPVPAVFYENGEPRMAIVLRDVVGQSDRYVLYENFTPSEFETWQIIQIVPFDMVKGYCMTDRNSGFFIDGNGALHGWEYGSP